MAELLEPHDVDMRSAFERDLQGTTRDPVSYEQLLQTRQRMLHSIRTQLTQQQRLFLLSFKEGNPRWEWLEVPHAHQLPAVQWKQRNIAQMSAHKHRQAVDKLKRVLELD